MGIEWSPCGPNLLNAPVHPIELFLPVDTVNQTVLDEL
jgi:hypothetical protein